MAFNLTQYNRQMLVKLAVISVAMFGFGYALIPMYRVLCEVTGINVVTSKNNYGTRAVHATSKNTQVDESRLITVEFDSNTQGPFRFRSVKNSMQVHPGEMIQVVYEVVNTQNRNVSAQAIPSYAPMQATEHFTKLECFCFNEQTLKPNESREMPVVFIIDPALPKGIKNITLSYTFFEVGAGQKVITGEHNSKPSKI
ncbi:cytochrome c oxidase assembly protein [Polynucleobacter cosmopolitanus]|uniref:Cytochrome c oxidase assembly protein CtaG n=1 Tax=Polynucleobacter cosmopolitanus TaxID=351345 RepID=A0A229FV25_9BURK|nr:cytochrome c oxidase assembly protein [Polynucleobacter cosmopolitanus]OXL15794.1 cytochrome c oxidase assembly protein [Polynucleobacter cosmopolitanus]